MRFVLAIGLLAIAQPLVAQEPPPRIGPFVVDLHATVPNFPQDPQLAASRDMQLGEMPGVGLGIQVGATVYVLRWKAITFGLGGEFASSHSGQTPLAGSGLRSATETFQTISPQLSFNFGTGYGWSYLSGGIGGSTWSIIPAGQTPFPADSVRMKTINYGGGARWFAKKHLAFSFDVRIYQIDPGAPYDVPPGTLPDYPAGTGLPGSPRTKLLILGAGISIK